MARFEAPRKPKAGRRKTVNLAGGQAYDRTPKVELATLVVNSMLKDTFYEKSGDQLARLQSAARRIAEEGDLLWCAKAACYARREHGLRTITHALAGEVAYLRAEFQDQRGDWGRRFFDRVVFRLDDMLEIAGYWIQTHGNGAKKTLPNPMKRGFANVLARAKPYHLAKWNGKGTRSLSLRQLAHLVHPKGPEGSAIWKLRAGTLEAADTHEVAMSRAGQKKNAEKAKADEWVRLLKEGKLRYMAALRNMRNVMEQAPEALDMLLAKIVSERDIRESKVLPMQILTAANAFQPETGRQAAKVREAIGRALDLALCNMPELPGATCVVLDDSGSMHRGDVPPPILTGSIFSATILKACEDVDFMKFSGDASYHNPDLSGNVISVANQLMLNPKAQGTNHSAPWHEMNRAYDRVFILSDEQGWMGWRTPDQAVRDYECRFECRPFIYSWDLTGSATSQFPEDRIAVLAGQSCAVFDILKQLETDPQALVHEIEKYEF